MALSTPPSARLLTLSKQEYSKAKISAWQVFNKNSKAVNAAIFDIGEIGTDNISNDTNIIICENPNGMPHLILQHVWTGTNPTVLPKINVFGEFDDSALSIPVGKTSVEIDARNAEIEKYLPKNYDAGFDNLRANSSDDPIQQWMALPSAENQEFDIELGDLAVPVVMQHTGSTPITAKFSREHVISTRGCRRIIVSIKTATVSPTKALILGAFAALN